MEDTGRRFTSKLPSTTKFPQQQQRVKLFPRQVRGQNAALLKAGRGCWTVRPRHRRCDGSSVSALQMTHRRGDCVVSRTKQKASLTPAEPCEIEAHVRPCARAAYLLPSRPCRPSCPAASRPAEPSLQCSRTKQFSRTVLDGSGGRDERSPTGPPRR